jgi:hypothetical protein
MGDMYIATIPQCPTHGKMKWIHPEGEHGILLDSYWICHGFDGEGCDHRVDEKDMDWTAINEETFRINGMTVGEPIHLRATGQLE